MLAAFLQGLPARSSGNFSLVVKFEKDVWSSPERETDSPEDNFKYTVGTRTWWQLSLAAAGYQIRRGHDNCTLVAEPVSKTNCGCACEVTRSLKLPQSVESYLDEFHLTSNLTSREKRALSFLRERDLPPDAHASCALVFSSGVLNTISPALGDMIDSHDAVLRMNHAPAKGQYTIAAGQKSTYRVVYVPEFGQHPEISPPHVEEIDDAMLILSVHFKRRARRVLDYNLQRSNQVCIVPTKVRERGSSCVFGTYHEHPLEDQQATGPHLSQGLVGLFLSLHLCKRTVIFGSTIGSSKEISNQLPFHYYETLHEGIHHMYSSVHGATEEAKFLADLQASGTVALVPGDL